jgi:DNA-binding CsgD family transcriptional regulator
VVSVDRQGQVESPARQIIEMKRLAARSGVITAEALDAYEQMVSAGQVTEPDAKKIMSPDVLRQLVDAKLVEASHEGLYFAVGPDLGLLTMMALSGRTAAGALDALTDAMRGLGSIHAAALRMYGGGPQAAGNGHRASPPVAALPENSSVELVTERHRILELTGHGGLGSEARNEFCALETASMEVRYTEICAREPTPVMQEAGVVSRTLYEHPFLEHESLRKGVATCIRGGEQARVLTRPAAVKMKIVDGHTVLVALTSTGVNRALLVRNSFLGEALQGYFDYLWDEATPLEINSNGAVVERVIPRADGLSVREQRIVMSMKNNKTLGEIARELKISEQTVSRTIDRIAARLGVEGRVALGAECQRLGYFG